MNNRFAPLIKLAISGLIVSLASFVIWISVNQGNDGFAVGAITQVSESSIMVADRYEAETIVIITDETEILRRHEVLQKEDLKEGDFVQVNGKPLDEKTIEAHAIRFLKPPKEGPRP